MVNDLTKSGPIESAVALTRTRNEISLDELLREIPGLTTNDVARAIQQRRLHADLDQPILEKDLFMLYSSREARIAAATMRAHACEQALSTFIETSPGAALLFEGHTHKIISFKCGTIDLHSEGSDTVVQMAYEDFMRKVKSGAVTSVTTVRTEASARMTDASPEDLRKANRKYLWVARKLGIKAEPPIGCPPPERTQSDWVKRWLHAEQRYGNGFVGLIDSPNKGNPGSRLNPAVDAIIKAVIDQHYSTPMQPSKLSSYNEFMHRSIEAGLALEEHPACSYRTFCDRIEKRNPREIVAGRGGIRAAKAIAAPHEQQAHETAPNGEYPWAICHVDSTEFDEDVRCPLTGKNLGRPTITTMSDPYTRRVRAYHLSFDPECVDTAFATLRMCVRLHGRLPELIVFDRAGHHRSEDMETFCRQYKVTKMLREPNNGRGGARHERLFRTINTQLLYSIPGNSQRRREIKKYDATADPDPKDLMTLTELSALVGAYLLEFYDSQVHLTLTVSPRDYERHVQSSTKFVGGKIVSNDRDLVINSSRIFAPVEVFPRSGVRVHYLDYWAPELDRVLGCKVAIKIDAADVRRVFAFVEGRWIDCRLPNEYRSLESRSVAEVIAATAAIRKARSAAKRTKRITGHEIARFIHNRGEIVRRVIEAAGTAAKNDDDRDYLRAAANDGAGSLLRNLCINHSGGDDAHEAATQPAPSAPAAQPEQPKQNQQPDEPRKKPRKPTTIKMK